MKLFRILNIDGFMKENQLDEATLVDYCTGFDSYIYLLFSRTPPQRFNGMFVNTIANAEYTAVKIKVDWNEGRIVSIQIHALGIHRLNYHYIRPLCGNFLLLGARCHYNDGNNPENNALVIDEAGSKKYEMCLGDGINDCITTEDGKIITSYFDEGVFGNYGWDQPIGSSGLIVWDVTGRILWKNEKIDFIWWLQ